jgi:GR25 family glycosyltransferase involved in LPS biosynthesis
VGVLLYERIKIMPSRYLCDVFDEMRKCHEQHNYSYLPGLIEEAQSLANRMESTLRAKRDYEYYDREKKKLKKEVDKLEAKKEKLNNGK